MVGLGRKAPPQAEVFGALFPYRLEAAAPPDRQRRVAFEAGIAVGEGAAHEGAAPRAQHLEMGAPGAKAGPRRHLGAVLGRGRWSLQTHSRLPKQCAGGEIRRCSPLGGGVSPLFLCHSSLPAKKKSNSS